MKIYKYTLISSIICSLLFGFYSRTVAQTASDFLGSGAQNSIISDENFSDINSMDVNAIQTFLTTNNSYLKDFSENGRSAAQIIYDAAHGKKFTTSPYDTYLGESYKGIKLDEKTGTISPKIILVFLQKEQSLISRVEKNDSALNRAMGYQCPDGGGCNPNYAGFTQQVEWGAWQLRYNQEAAKLGADWWSNQYRPGYESTVYVGMQKTLYDYTGSYNITYNNAATASIYRYTPHVFDSAYNVWNLFNFVYFSGSTPAAAAAPPPPPPPPPPKPGDVNSDGKVDLLDLSVFSNNWGQTNLQDNKCDFNNDGNVDIQDLSILASHWE